jgi:hypothetical protein
VPLDGAALESFAASVWPLVVDSALVDIQHWGNEFLEHQLGSIVAVSAPPEATRDLLCKPFALPVV